MISHIGVRVCETRSKAARELANTGFVVLRLRRGDGGYAGWRRTAQVAPKLSRQDVAQGDRAQLRQRGIYRQLQPKSRPDQLHELSSGLLRLNRRVARVACEPRGEQGVVPRGLVEDGLQD